MTMAREAETFVLDGIVRTFWQGERRLDVLGGASIALKPGECVALVGPSGAGKSTLLHVAGLLDRPDAGEVRYGAMKLSALDDGERTRARRWLLGFVYQYHHLLPEFSALENVMLPQLIAGVPRTEARRVAADLLDRFGLAARLNHRPGRLSGGEQQRVAIARALANRPKILLADEPTGNLDQGTADIVFGELVAAAKRDNLAALLATHNEVLAARADRRVQLQNGVLVEG
ncbi:MAG: ABC transporter ATP-binding protein [Alphaproteobacteria bacterium]|nr:ABC transporter ATP-binding protein [Alphaproteobacteria bacterium]